jgi:excisionase family DNA binding protein
MSTCTESITSNLLNVKQVAAIFGASRQTIIRWVASGELKSFRMGNVLRFTPGDVEKFIQSNQAKQNAKA